MCKVGSGSPADVNHYAALRPLFHRKRTSKSTAYTSAKCQKEKLFWAYLERAVSAGCHLSGCRSGGFALGSIEVAHRL
jgi:hypothetical protein